MDYWNMDEFLAEEEKVTCTFLSASYQNAELENFKEKDIEEDKVLEIPIWLALSLDSIKAVSIEEPIYFKENFVKAIWSDPEVFNLREKYNFLYELAIKLHETVSDKSYFTTLYSILEKRSKEFYKVSKHIKSDETMNFKKKMSQFEIKIFEESLKVAQEYNFWLSSKKGANTMLGLAYKKIKTA